MVAQLYLAEGALPDGLAKNIVADVFELSLRLTGGARYRWLLLRSCRRCCILTLLRAMAGGHSRLGLPRLRCSAAPTRLRVLFLRLTPNV